MNTKKCFFNACFLIDYFINKVDLQELLYIWTFEKKLVTVQILDTIGLDLSW